MYALHLSSLDTHVVDVQKREILQVVIEQKKMTPLGLSPVDTAVTLHGRRLCSFSPLFTDVADLLHDFLFSVLALSCLWCSIVLYHRHGA